MSGPAAGLFESWSWWGGGHWGPLENFRSICGDFPPQKARLRTESKGKDSLVLLCSEASEASRTSPVRGILNVVNTGVEVGMVGHCQLVIGVPGYLLMA